MSAFTPRPLGAKEKEEKREAKEICSWVERVRGEGRGNTLAGRHKRGEGGQAGRDGGKGRGGVEGRGETPLLLPVRREEGAGKARRIGVRQKRGLGGRWVAAPPLNTTPSFLPTSLLPSGVPTTAFPRCEAAGGGVPGLVFHLTCISAQLSWDINSFPGSLRIKVGVSVSYIHSEYAENTLGEIFI